MKLTDYIKEHYARITKELTSEEFDSFVEFKTMQHNQAQVFLMGITKGVENRKNTNKGSQKLRARVSDSLDSTVFVLMFTLVVFKSWGKGNVFFTYNNYWTKQS